MVLPAVLGIFYIVLGILVCRHRKRLGGAHCGIGKCFLMPVLALFVISCLYSPFRFVISGRVVPEVLFPVDTIWLDLVIALLLGGLGDTFLELGGAYNAAGVLAFLAGHIFYIRAAARQIAAGRMIPAAAAAAFLLFYLIVIFLFGVPILKKAPGILRIGCTVYLVFLVGMSFSMSLRLACVPVMPYLLGLSGSLLFLFSDCRIGRHVFLDRPNTWIMETYTVAQFLLALGFVCTF